MSKRGKPSGTVRAAKGNSPGPLPGQAGYRTRTGRSGYDPIDSRTEAAYSAGTFLKRLFTARLIVENALLLAVMGLFGVIAVLPLFLGVSESLNGRALAWDTWVLFLIAGALGFLLLMNFTINLIRLARGKSGG